MSGKPTLSHQFGAYTLEYFYNPGMNMTNTQVRSLHSEILRVNDQAKTSLTHNLLLKDISDEQLKEQYNSAIVVIFKHNSLNVGFQFCPVLSRGDSKILHAGLVMINTNKGANLLGFASIGVTLLAYKNLGQIYFTNISSTPSIIEAVTRLGTEVWPSPNMNLVRPPKGYRNVAKTLVDDYVLKYFPDTTNIEFDAKRFVIRSNSQKMGFKTDPRQLSRPSDFKFYNFCFLWLDYDKEEDLIQIGKVDRKSMIKAKMFYLAMRMKYSRRKEQESSSPVININQPVLQLKVRGK